MDSLFFLPSDWTFLSHPDWDRRSSTLRSSHDGSSDPQPAPRRRVGYQWWGGGWSREPDRHLEKQQGLLSFNCMRHSSQMWQFIQFKLKWKHLSRAETGWNDLIGWQAKTEKKEMSVLNFTVLLQMSQTQKDFHDLIMKITKKVN